MQRRPIVLPLVTALALTLAAGAAAAHRPDATVRANFSQALPNVPGKSLVAVEVSYPPGGASPPHHHARSAFIYAYVVSGRIVSQVAGEPERSYAAGESFHERPGAHHLISRNASDSEPARLLAVFVVDGDDEILTTPDQQEFVQ